jgi:hypothetical protein
MNTLRALSRTRIPQTSHLMAATMASKASELQMRVLVAPSYCTPEKYDVIELQRPAIKEPHEVLVEVHAASINPRDVKQAKGLMKIMENIRCVTLCERPCTVKVHSRDTVIGFR